MQLKQGSLLQGGKYRIEKVLGQGGFGITYLGEQTSLGRQVAIKEFFMKEFCERDETTSHVSVGSSGSRELVARFREKFVKEARNIAKLNHPNIVRVIDIFEENGTAYYVMEFAENGSLSDKVKKEGCLSEPLATKYIKQVADALNYIHGRKMNHLDVKPGNIMLNGNDDAILIDFGLSKQYDETTGKQTSTTPVGISEGYAPMEQYKHGGVCEFSPETDVYALGATFFKLLTGITPPSASDVYEDGVPVSELKSKRVSDKTISVICKAMEGRKKVRINSIHMFMEALKFVGTSVTSSPKPKQTEDETTNISPIIQHKNVDISNEDSNALLSNLGVSDAQLGKNSHFCNLMILSIITLSLIAVLHLMNLTECYNISKILSFISRTSVIILLVGIVLSGRNWSKYKSLLFISAFICSLQYLPINIFEVLGVGLFVILSVSGWFVFALFFFITSLKTHYRPCRITNIMGIVYSISCALYIINSCFFAPHLMQIPYFFVLPFDFTPKELTCIIFLLTSFSSLITIALVVIRNKIRIFL